jgi:hypothetical protein
VIAILFFIELNPGVPLCVGVHTDSGPSLIPGNDQAPRINMSAYPIHCIYLSSQGIQRCLLACLAAPVRCEVLAFDIHGQGLGFADENRDKPVHLLPVGGV